VVWTKEPAATQTASSTSSTAAPALQTAAAQTAASPATTHDAAPAPAKAAAGAGSAVSNVSALQSAQIRQVTYVVRPGDSLYSISRRFRVSVTDISQWNGVAAEKILKPGQRLKMFIDVTEQSG
jgi:LysM repeat protein